MRYLDLAADSSHGVHAGKVKSCNCPAACNSAYGIVNLALRRNIQLEVGRSLAKLFAMGRRRGGARCTLQPSHPYRGPTLNQPCDLTAISFRARSAASAHHEQLSISILLPRSRLTANRRIHTAPHQHHRRARSSSSGALAMRAQRFRTHQESFLTTSAFRRNTPEKQVRTPSQWAVGSLRPQGKLCRLFFHME